MIIPNKSTIAEEEIEVPYGRNSAAARSRGPGGGGRGSDSEREDEMSPRSPAAGGLGGLSGLSARLQQADEDEVPGRGSGEEYYDRSYGRQSAASDRSTGTAGIGSRMLSGGGGRASVAEDNERVRREYEFKIATMQTRITGLERDLEDVQERERKWVESEKRVRAMESELSELRRVSTSLLSVIVCVD